MAILPQLFNLNSGAYNLGRSTGRFRGIVQNNAVDDTTGQLISMLGGISMPQFTEVAPTLPNITAPVAPEIPTDLLSGLTKPTVPNLTVPTAPASPISQEQYNKSLAEYNSARDYFQQQLKLRAAANFGSLYKQKTSELVSQAMEAPWNAGVRSYPEWQQWAKANKYYAYGMTQSWWDMYARYKTAGNTLTDYNNQYSEYQKSLPEYQKQVAAYNDAVNNYKNMVEEYNTKAAAAIAPYQEDIDKYKQDATAYNSTIGVFNEQLNKYNKAVETYKTDTAEARQQKEGIINTFLGNLQGREVTAPTKMQSEGEQLAETALYSDALHQEMINKVGAANAEPVEDRVSSLFSR